MKPLLLIPDDYSSFCRRFAARAETAGYRLAVCGDLAREPQADTLLAEAHTLLLLRERTQIDDALLARCPQLKLVSQTGKIALHIDVDACARHGVAVVEGSGSPIAPAELAWLLLMAAWRRLVPAVNGLYGGQWQTTIGRAVHGHTLGILGFGKIGQRIALFGQTFGMRVLVWGSEGSRLAASAAGYEAAASREAFFAESDILTVHQRLVPATQGQITAADLALMKTDALFVNTSRAELVAPGALLAALQAGRPGFAALDVFEHEPLYDVTHPLLQLPNVLCSPHLGYAEQAGLEGYVQTALDNAAAFLAKETGGV